MSKKKAVNKKSPASEAASLMAKARWAKTTPEERAAAASKAGKASAAVRNMAEVAGSISPEAAQARAAKAAATRRANTCKKKAARLKVKSRKA